MWKVLSGSAGRIFQPDLARPLCDKSLGAKILCLAGLKHSIFFVGVYTGREKCQRGNKTVS